MVSWCESNGLELNISKWKVIRYSRMKIITLPSYHIHNSALECLFQINDLGIILDSKLTFCSHIEKIVKNSNKMLGFMVRQCSEFDNLRALVLLYNALVRSNLEYNTIIWCPLYQNAIHRIEKIQRKFIKFACYKCHIHFDRNNYDNIFAYFGLSTLRSRRIQLNLCFFFKVINYMITCSSILGLFLLHVPQCNFRSVHLLVVPYHRTNYGLRSPLSRICRNVNLHSHNVEFYNIKYT
jgi:hypothetical protein